MLKNLGKNRLKLLKLFNKANSENKVTEDWDVGIVLPIFKELDKIQYQVSHCLVWYKQILEQRLKKVIELQLDQFQNGFRKSIQDLIFSIKQLMGRAKETSKNIYATLFDIEKVQRKAIKKSIMQT